MKRLAHFSKISFCLLLIFLNSLSFDWSFYVKKYDLEKYNINRWYLALDHFIHHGIAAGLHSTPIPIDNTNFDWEYYVEKNQLKDLRTETDAYNHYVNTGKSLNLEYCKSFKIVILLHLYNLQLMDEFIQKINFFMKNNPTNIYFVKINIPIDDRVFQFADKFSGYSQGQELLPITYIKAKTPYHQVLINNKNAQVLSDIACYLEKQLNIPENRLQIIFSENRGLDIGGFFLLLDQIKKENLDFDFLIKLHTKRFNANHPGEGFGPNFGTGWRNILTSFLNIKINKILRSFECIYSCKLTSVDGSQDYDPTFVNLKKNLYNILNVSPEIQYNFCAGTIFIAPFKFYKAIRHWNFLSLFNMLNLGGIALVGYENVYERLFGYYFDILKLKIFCLDYYNPEYPIKYEI